MLSLILVFAVVQDSESVGRMQFVPLRQVRGKFLLSAVPRPTPVEG